MYHGTFAEFEKFELKKGLGIHVGTLEQAQKRIADMLHSKTKQPTTPPVLYEVSITINRPLRLRDTGWHDVFMVRKRLVEFGIIANDEQLTFPQMRAAIQKQGYDGVVYRNEIEADKKDSYIVFDPTQIKIIRKL